jgi:hypothetical protein
MESRGGSKRQLGSGASTHHKAEPAQAGKIEEPKSFALDMSTDKEDEEFERY